MRSTGDFGVKLRALLRAARVNADEVCRRLSGQRASVSRSTLYDWMNGSHLPEHTDSLTAVVELCLDLAREHGAAPEPADVAGWLALLADARRSREPGAAEPPRGRTADRWDPVALGVHEAIGGVLPRYVRRPHDDLLHALLDPDPAANRLVVLRGGSSTGKSRAAYEGVAARLPNWPVLYPRTAAALTRWLRDGVAGRSVLWLNELRHYAEDPAGAEALFELAELLTGRHHVVVVTTLWPHYWSAYLAPHHGGPGTADPNRAVRELLTPLPEVTGRDPRQVDVGRGGVIEVPDHFTATELRGVGHDDPGLGEAVAAAENAGSPGRLAQYLAGVPHVLAHWAGPGADPHGRALITAAMDAVRLGHSSLLSRELLTDAAVGYLDDLHRTVPVAEWEPAAWNYATRVLKGTIRALGPVPPEQGTGVAGYQVADYLDQHGREHRRGEVAPASLWDAAVRHARDDDRRRLAEAAEDRGRYRSAARLLHAAAANGDRDAAVELARLLEQRGGRAREAEAWWRRAADLGVPTAMAVVGRGLERQGRLDEALVWWRRATDAGDQRAPVRAAYALEAAGRTAEAHDWWERAERATAGYAVRRTAEMLIGDGRSDEAHAWLRAKGDSGVRWADLARLLVRQGRATEAIDIWMSVVEEGDPDSGLHREEMRTTVELMVDAGREEEAIGWLRSLAGRGNPIAPREVVEHLVARGRTDEAVDWLKDRAARSRAVNDHTASWVADLLDADGRSEEALTWLRERADAGDPTALVRAMRMSYARGEAEQLHTWPASPGSVQDDTAPLRRIAELLHADGRPAAGVVVTEEIVENVFYPVAVHGLPIILRRDHADTSPEQAIVKWERAAESGDPGAVLEAVVLLDLVGAYDEALRRITERPRREVDDIEQVRAWLREKVESGDPQALIRVADFAAGLGRSEEALTWYRRAADRGDLHGHLRLVDLLRKLGHVEELRRMASSATGRYAVEALVGLLVDQGRADEAADWVRAHHLGSPADPYLDAGRIDEAVVELRRDADEGNRYALDRIAALLPPEDAERLRCYGLNPDGTDAEPWNVPPPRDG